MPRVTGIIYIDFDSPDMTRAQKAGFENVLLSAVDALDLDAFEMAERCGFKINAVHAITFDGVLDYREDAHA